MSKEHFIIVCSCGAVISQCRCMSKDKTRTVLNNGCPTCKAEAAAKAPPVRPTREASGS